MADKELLSITDTLLEYKSILYSTIIMVDSDYKNLTHENILHMNAKYSVEDFGYDIYHIAGEKNDMVDVLSRLGIKSAINLRQ